MPTKLTAGQRKFLKAVASGEGGVFHVRVTKALWDADYVQPVYGSLYPFLVGCNGQNAADYMLTARGASVAKAA